MSLLADFYVSSDDDALSYDTAPERFAGRVQCKHFTPLELSMLWSIMQGVEWDAVLMDGFPCLLQMEEGERLIHRLPPEMVAELAALSQDRITLIAPAWAAAEELSCGPEDVRPVIDDLTCLARRAAGTGCGLYLWNCL